MVTLKDAPAVTWLGAETENDATAGLTAMLLLVPLYDPAVAVRDTVLVVLSVTATVAMPLTRLMLEAERNTVCWSLLASVAAVVVGDGVAVVYPGR